MNALNLCICLTKDSSPSSLQAKKLVQSRFFLFVAPYIRVAFFVSRDNAIDVGVFSPHNNQTHKHWRAQHNLATKLSELRSWGIKYVNEKVCSNWEGESKNRAVGAGDHHLGFYSPCDITSSLTSSRFREYLLLFVAPYIRVSFLRARATGEEKSNTTQQHNTTKQQHLTKNYNTYNVLGTTDIKYGGLGDTLFLGERRRSKDDDEQIESRCFLGGRQYL